VDRELVVARVNQLRAGLLSASQAFGLGLVIPGGGQFYAKRPVLGILSLLGVGAGVTVAMMEKTTTTTATKSGTDPFGNPYTYPVTTASKSHPYLVSGLAAGGGLALVSAIDAALYVRSHRGSSLSVSLLPGASRVGVVANVRVR
jgi:hypothetical protein